MPKESAIVDKTDCTGSSDEPRCIHKTFTNNDLEPFCGTNLNATKQTLRLDEYWLCSRSYHKEKSDGGRRTFSSQFSALEKLQSKYGKERFNDENIRVPLQRFEPIPMVQYVYRINARRMNKLLDLPLLSNEQTPEHRELVQLLRSVLGVREHHPLRLTAAARQLRGLEHRNLLR